MSLYRFFFLFFFLMQNISLHAEGLDIINMFNGMGQAFGVAPQGYYFKFQLWNNSYRKVYVEIERIAQFMGGFFRDEKVNDKKDHGFHSRKTLPSLVDAAGKQNFVSYDQSYYHIVHIGREVEAHQSPVYQQYCIQLPLQKHDTKVYYFNAYTKRKFDKGKMIYDFDVEMLGYQDPQAKSEKEKGSVVISSQLSNLNFVNSTSSDVQVTMTYHAQPYTFTVEKYSYASLGLPTPQQKKPKATQDSVVQKTVSKENLDEKKSEVVLQSDQDLQPVDSSKKETEPAPPFSLRPNTITFAKYNTVTKKSEKELKVLLSEQGFDGYPYTFEIFENSNGTINVGFQGLTPGNYDVPVQTRNRDVTPCPSFFWYQSVDQVPHAAENGYADLPGQVWIVYAGKDNPVKNKISPGQVVTWNITRPYIEQGDVYLYCMYVATTDDEVASKFVDKVSQNLLGKDLLQAYDKEVKKPFDMSLLVHENLDVTQDDKKVEQKLLDAQQEVATLLGNLHTTSGLLEDKDTGVIGYFLGADIFSPKGVGFGRFYYVLSPSLLSVSNVVSLFSLNLDSAKQDTKTLTSLINTWIVQYLQDPVATEKIVEQYCITHGNAQITDGKQLTKYGKICLKNMMTGSVSIKYPPLKLSTVTNQYVYDFGQYTQDDWPAAVPLGTAVAKVPQGLTLSL